MRMRARNDYLMIIESAFSYFVHHKILFRVIYNAYSSNVHVNIVNKCDTCVSKY